MNDTRHRMTRIGYQIAGRRIGEYAFRAALTRLAAVSVMTVGAAAGHARWWCFVIIAIAAVGSALSLSDSFHTERGTEPAIPVVRALFRVTTAAHGQNKVNPPGVIEALSYAPMVLVGPWLMTSSSELTRLVCLAAALVYVGSCVSIVFVDPAFYNPHVVFPRWIEAVRAAAGVLSVLIAAPVVLTAPWSHSGRWVAAGLCAALITISLRIRETDRLLDLARISADNEQIVGRQAITRHLHSMVGTPLHTLHTVLNRSAQADPDTVDAFRDVEGGYRQLLGMDEAADLDIDWPGLLGAHLRALAGRYGTLYRFSVPEDVLSRTDRVLAHLVLDDLATNAANAAATECDMTLQRGAGGFWEASATDNGAPINEQMWMRAGGGLARLNVKLSERGGGITYQERRDGRKTVTARWQATPNTQEKNR